MTRQEPVAVIGMACRYPGAPDVGRFWSLLRAGAEGISRLDAEEVLAAGGDPELTRRPDFVPAMGLLTGARGFDWTYFGYSRAEAASIDPQQRVFLECVVAALDDAALDPARFPGWIGVYGGADQVTAEPDGELGELARYIGLGPDFLATRVAYKLGLRGPAVTVQTACSTSLTAVHMAAASLRGGECDVALAGGVAVIDGGERGYLYEPGGILSPDGHCRTFDERAGGTVPSEGVGVVVLKRLADARRDGDRVLAVIRGSAINNDGAEKMGYTAPSVEGQSELIAYAQRLAGVDPRDIGYVEAHGTGTRIGDPIEVQALTDVFQADTGATGWCRLGAVKSNIGHTGSAAGVAGLIKAVLMLRHRELVPSVHFTRPNPLLELETTPFVVSTRTEPWTGRDGRLAGVSSFGVGGTNAHVILEEAPARTAPPVRGGRRVLTLSAAAPEALGRLRANLAEHLRATPDLHLSEVSATLASRRVHQHRQTVVAEDTAEAATLLAAPGASVPGALDKVAFVFPGHGLLTHPAGVAAHRLLPGFRAAFDEVRDLVRERHGLDLSPIVTENAEPAWFSRLVPHQVGLFALGYALGRQLLELGIRPVAMLGNSIGEYAPATLAGLWTLPDAVDLVHLRASAMLATRPGRMAAVGAAADELADRLADKGFGELSLAVRGPGRVVVSGPEAAMTRLLDGDLLVGLDVRVLDIPRAFHSTLMNPAADELAGAVAAKPNAAPRIRLVSNTSGGWAEPDSLRGPGYWAGQLREPVLLEECAGTLLESGCDTFLELGPGTSMLATLRRHEAWKAGNVTVPLLGRAEDGDRGVLRALGSIWERGADAVAGLLEEPGERPPVCSLPTYPFSDEEPDFAVRRPPSIKSTVDGPGESTVERLWCAALGVPSADAADDFYALGGESLMAVNLMSKIRERTGASVPVAEFDQEATFGRLSRLVAERSAAPGPRHTVDVVTFHEDGPGTPLLLIADSAGSALSYRALADELAGARPVHGFEIVSGREKGIDAIAAHYVDAVLRTRSDGPYLLGGWSFGAVLAHEVARQLTRRGADVDTVVGLDGFVQGRRDLPMAVDPGFLASHGRTLVDAAFGFGAIGREVRRNPALRTQLLGKARALVPYRPPFVPARALVFRAGSDRRGAARLRARLAPLYGGGVQVFTTPGDHWSLLTQPHVGVLARELNGALAGAERMDHVG
ncbi:beta-ketoacyl synthase [Amycolatopsis sp. WAC 04197]|uniref:type I polyketide synthase n=1 Tax=Amycolatopsis sp. WAC 04197 TaxID=2203199 RepID=UPI000F798C3F|nr:type I polyketide synthase [Amycolatopsis sp. WAC 04197]RSN50237.1 beta-ketoacyl synthase [Amycolatopsis sp. WAC 04197]